ncbi:MAG: hydantoinase/oxoprolinase family protein [Eubacterium sp.]|nr:hydantoinase/oxoprolinase family protein [Eubacterium sp.]
MIGLGIDTGGTCTDAVIYDSDTEQVLSTGKTLTTKRHLEDGIANAIRMLDPDILPQVRFVSLSTTLATNACVENRGGRAKLLLIGADRKVLQKVYREYGFDSLDDVLVIDGVPEGGYSDAAPPDWDDLAAIMDAFARADAIGVVQLYPQKNGGAYEKTARELLLEHYDVPVICGSELFSDRNIIRRGAGTYLNARLIPVIHDFIGAVKHVLADFSLDVPIYVVRSDGSLMKESFALEHPVETLLCGPAASALGGIHMAGDDDALIIDIGGTTTDVAIIRDGMAVTVDDGIRINGWKTFVKGMFIDTFGLGGDSAVRYDGQKLSLSPTRQIPIAMVCAEYPQVADKLRNRANWVSWFDRYPYEGYVLLHDPEEKRRSASTSDNKSDSDQASGLHFNEWQRTLIDGLRKGPMMIDEIAEIEGRYQLAQRLATLEQNETILRFGLTPTDMMHLRGDYDAYDTESARIAAGMLSQIIQIPVEELPNRIYDAFVKKLVCNIERILIDRRFPEWQDEMPASISAFLEKMYEDDPSGMSGMHFTSNLPIIGVGGPSHIFMEQAAAALHTHAILPRYAPVANALGTLAGKIVVKESADIIASPFGDPPGYRVFLGEDMRDVETFSEAASLLTDYLYQAAEEKARERGARGKITISHKLEKKENLVMSSMMLHGGTVTVTAQGNII